MGGGKGGNNTPPPQQVDTSAQQTMLAQQMASLAALQQQSQMLAQQQAASLTQFPEIPPAPEPIKSPVADWAKRREELAQKVKADYNLSKKRKKGRQDTIATSPLLDDQDATTTDPNSLLSTTSTL